MYQELRGEKTNTPWYKLFFHNVARPWARFTLWIDLWNILPTKSRLARFGIATDGKCNFCRSEESQEHMFFACSFTGEIWQKILNWIGFNRVPYGWNSEKEWAVVETSKKGWKRPILKAAIAETIYAIWTLRNAIIFKDQSMEEDIQHKTKTNVAIRCSVIPKLSNHVNLEELSIR
ncbi:uncharacterized protein LOC131598474 [Vicia villosa]|uniref:uncharacterized protein LOC131598474 n=1 Tax=Vicia villosa TaxID=3911 RepID=UPI00273B36F2|nr:uncharacterized protein LOC131598474 [Vicia villosa]